MDRTIEIDGQSLTVDDVARVARREARVELAATARARMAVTRRVVEGIVARNEVVYGVTTGF
ncbi:MAG TPA: aromatic amino acid lyase, partial [Gemmatimonadaceae bacterium]|nr:aromatic amino acid lyase [Gemmatimonadaceae bacterium]